MYPLWINVVGFQAGWWACVGNAGGAFEIHSLVFALALVVAHLWWSSSPAAELQLAALGLVLGIAVDSLLQSVSVISFYGWALGPLSPFWLWALWVMFSLTLNASLAFLQSMPWWVSALAGCLLGPLTYYAGVQFGAASLHENVTSLFFLALTWTVVLPLMVFCAHKLFHTNRGVTP